MIERVARAIARTDPEMNGQFDENEFGDAAWNDWRDYYIVQARAAIEAMREPTDAMESAGHCVERTGADILSVWDAMIDEALK